MTGQPPVETGASTALRIQGVSVRLGDRLALNDVSFDILLGAFVGLIGPNGSGKSTLLRSILGVLPLTSGSIEVEGCVPADARDLFAYLPQRQHVQLDLPLRARDVVMMGRLRHTGWLKPPSRVDKEAVDAAMERVGLADRRNSPIAEMSFGQQQRVFFARALVQEGRIVLLDEPMNGVDPNTQEVFLRLLAEFQTEGKTIVMATHDLNQAVAVCDYICVINQRLIAYGPTREALTEDVLHEAYGIHFHFPDGHHLLEDVHHHGAHA